MSLLNQPEPEKVMFKVALGSGLKAAVWEVVSLGTLAGDSDPSVLP